MNQTGVRSTCSSRQARTRSGADVVNARLSTDRQREGRSRRRAARDPSVDIAVRTIGGYAPPPAAQGLTLRIVVDVSPLSLPRTGIGNYLRSMVGGLAEVATDDEVVAFAPTGLRGTGKVRRALDGIPVETKVVTLPAAHLFRVAWSKSAWPPLERLVGRFDVFHFSDWMYPPQRTGVRTTTIHDLVPLHFPELVHPRTLRLHGAKYRNAAATCDVVFTNSRFTASDVAEHLKIPSDRIQVAYPGIDRRFTPSGDRADLGAPYLLTVSTVDPRKNIEVVIKAFELVREGMPELQLAVAGGIAPGTTPPPSRSDVHLLGFVEDERLAALYRGAAAFVYASRFEGFGMPIVEALASGTPTVASSHPSLDEASGAAAFRAKSDDPEAFADRIVQALHQPAERREEGLAHAARFTWEACGEAVLHGYQSAL
jgi:glycosyltransferase involved in cell wall biosynthesis